MADVFEEIAIDMAKNMSISRLEEELNKKYRDKGIRKEVKKVLKEKEHCPDCDNLFMEDPDNNVLYCPLGHYEIEL